MANTQPVALLFKRTNVMLGTITLDVSISETHTSEAEITDNPVEQGANVSDHIRPLPESVQIEGLVTNTPVSAGAQSVPVTTANGTTFGSRSSYVSGAAEDAYAQLRGLRDNGTLVTITTALRVYPNMVLRSLVVPRDAKSGKALKFTAIFKQIRVVQNQTIAIARSEPKTKPTKNNGKKGAAPDPVPRSKSVLKSGSQKVAGLFGIKYADTPAPASP